MAILQKTICTNINDVKAFLQGLGFTIGNDGKIIWSYASNDTGSCYLFINNDIINLHQSDGFNAFENSLVDFSMSGKPKCAIISLPLQDNGIAIYLGMIAETTTLSDIYLCCANTDALLNNGLVVISPPEDDGHWYYGWNYGYSTSGSTSIDDSCIYWNLDNGHGNYEYGINLSQMPVKQLYNTAMSLTIVRPYLNSGHWGRNIKMQVTGEVNVPGQIYKINGQKYITISNNSSTRAPVYKLPPEDEIINLSTSTEAFSTSKRYAIGDYCIYNELLYRCVSAVTQPGPFDQSQWMITTVYNELLDQQNHIYGQTEIEPELDY